MAARSGLVPIARRLRDDVSEVRFGGLVAHVYNPLTYAWAPHREYLERYGRGRPGVLIVGMNAGYFGMVQTGVPFGDVEMVRDWLAIQQPARRHTEDPVCGRPWTLRGGARRGDTGRQGDLRQRAASESGECAGWTELGERDESCARRDGHSPSKLDDKGNPQAMPELPDVEV